VLLGDLCVNDFGVFHRKEHRGGRENALTPTDQPGARVRKQAQVVIQSEKLCTFGPAGVEMSMIRKVIQDYQYGTDLARSLPADWVKRRGDGGSEQSGSLTHPNPPRDYLPSCEIRTSQIIKVTLS